MKLSIVIVAYNSKDTLLNCLDSIEKYNDIGSDLDIIIVDNFINSDMTSKTFINYDLKIKYIRSINKGFGAGNNIGVANSESDVILFLNPDTILVEPIFKDIVLQINNIPNLIYAFSLLDKNMKRNNSYSFLYDSFFLFQIFSFFQAINLKSFFKIPFVNKYIWPWGAAFALSKISFYEAGCFDKNIFLCNEEQDLIKRIPHRLIYLSNKHIIHLEGHGRTVSESRWYEYFRSRDYYFNKYNISKFNQFLWNKYTYLVALLNSMHKKDQSLNNYYNAYKLYFKNK